MFFWNFFKFENVIEFVYLIGSDVLDVFCFDCYYEYGYIVVFGLKYVYIVYFVCVL